jgi:hypothetical protein
VDASEDLIGFRLPGPQDTPHPTPDAVAVAFPVPAHDWADAE